MKFLLYLVSKGVISAQLLVDAIEAQYDRITPIGQLAIEEDVLSARNVFKVLRCQADLPNERFGDVAIELGLMSEADLNRLLMLQESRKEPLLDVLIRQGILSREQVKNEMVAYRKHLKEQGLVTTQRVKGDSTSAAPSIASPRINLEGEVLQGSAVSALS